MSEIAIATRDGSCRSFVYRPAGRGPWPAVLLPDLFYRLTDLMDSTLRL